MKFTKLVVAILLSILMVSGVACQEGQGAEPTPMPTPMATTSPPPTPTPIIEETEEDKLDTILPGIGDYPKLEQVFKDMYGFGGFDNDEIEFMQIAFDIYREKEELREYPVQVLYYFAYRFPWRYAAPTSAYDNEFFTNTVRERALTLIGDNDLETARNIYEWVGSFLTGEQTIYSMPTLETIWEVRDDSCQYRSILMLALLRSVGIPARETVSDEISHSWVEVYHDGEWIPIPSTGVLDSDQDGLVDMKERIVEDVLVNAFVKADTYGIYYGRYIGYKYSLYHIERILAYAPNQEYKSLSQEYIDQWGQASSWTEREEFGERAMLYGVASLTNEENVVYMANELKSFACATVGTGHDFSLESGTVVLGIYDNQGLEWGDWSYDRNYCTTLGVLIENLDKAMFIVFINRETGEVVFMDNNDVQDLLLYGNDFIEVVPDILVNFSNAIKNVQDGKTDSVEVVLPQAGYYIGGPGNIVEDGYEYRAMIVGKKKVRGLEFEFDESGDSDIRARSFINIMFKDSDDRLLIEVNTKGYLEECPSDLRIPFGQTLIIQREGAYTVVRGDMSLEE